MTRMDEWNNRYAAAEELLHSDWQAACIQFEQLAKAAEAALADRPDDVALAHIAARSLYEVAEYYGGCEGKRSKARKIWQRGRSHLQKVLPHAVDADSRAELLYRLGCGHFDEADMWKCFNNEHLLAAFQAALTCFEQAFAERPDSESALLAAESLRLQHQDNCTGEVSDGPDDYAYLQEADQWYQRALTHADADSEAEIWFKRGRMYARAAEEGQPCEQQAGQYLRHAVYGRLCHVQAACELTKLLLPYSVLSQPKQARQAWADVQALMDYVRTHAPDDAAAWWGSAAAFNTMACAEDFAFSPNEYRTAQSWCVQAALLQVGSECTDANEWSGVIQGACAGLNRQELLAFLAETELALQRILPHHAETAEKLHDEIAEYWSDYQPDPYPWQHPLTLPENGYGQTDGNSEHNCGTETDADEWLASCLNDTAMPNRALFAQWLLALYNGQTRFPAEIVQQWQDEYGDSDADFTPAALFENFFALHNLLPDYSRLFAVDWRDGDSLTAYAQDVAGRFGITLQWHVPNRKNSTPDALLPQFAAQIAEHAAVYSLHTGGDYYYIAVADRNQAAQCERIAAQWQLDCDTVRPDAPAPKWFDKISRLFQS